LRSKVCSHSNAKFVEIATTAEAIALEKKINTMFNFSLRLDEVPRTLFIAGGKVVASILGFR
jgi:hypothetical protein